jgi:3-oxoadipate enol-lactonase/4-carboxymuconolactone decarboxylase
VKPDLALTDFGGAKHPLLVVGPSLGTSVAGLWSAAADRLAAQFRVVGWDLPGHGDSAPATGFTVADLAAAILAAIDGPFHYAGVSLGGAVGQQLLIDAPDRIVRATLLSTGPRILTPDAWHERAADVRAGGTACLLDATPQRWFAPAHRDSAAAKALLDDLAATDADSYAAACAALAEFDVRDRLAEIAKPVVAVAGAHDPVTPIANLRHLAEGVQRGQLAVIDDAGHLSPAEVPDVIADLIAAPAHPADETTSARLRAEGIRVRREVLGDEHVDRASAVADDFTAEFQQLLTRYAWGTIWTRPGLDRRSRSLITLTALVARGHWDELAMHLRGALRNGLTRDEIKELLLQTAIYCGVPDANAAFRVAQRVFDEDDRESRRQADLPRVDDVRGSS